jgi:DNA-binding MarR family transcriptional regulator
MGSQVSDTRLVLDALRKLVRGLRLSAARAEKQLGVSGAQLFVLEQLRGGHTLSTSELALATRTDPSSVSGVVQRLVAAKLVVCKRASADARRKEIALTARGKALLARGPKALQGELVAALESLPSGDRQALAHTLSALVAALGLGDAAPLFFEGEKHAR